ncbi:SRPBCC family protein [Rhodoferax antarcticus]|uniref:SRPBCC family protein n=1 Tax=Rhodoferax antarcticus TaxID=81479 RepID=UPI0022256070|nr:SRPBCC family protein [Rhodoferax antarcticus]MCW2313477.1 carbon monoxide dehydrogenase subunit G [Rhodoferax antarcticus]
MTVTVNLDLGYAFAVKAPYQTVFEMLSDVPKSASHFPKLDQLVDLGDGIYRWEMAKIGVSKFVLQTIYASKYVSDVGKGSVVWTPVKGEGNALVSGSWKVVDKKKSTHLTLHIKGVVEMPLPSMVKMIVVPAVQGEFEKLVEQYIANLTKRFGGEV